VKRWTRQGGESRSEADPFPLGIVFNIMSKQFSALALCVAALSVAYYFAYYLPRAHDAELADQHRKTELELAQRCRTDGLKFFNDFSAEVNDPSLNYTWDDPEFHYSAKLNTCLVSVRYLRFGLDSATSFHYNRVVDVYGNRPILLGEFKRIVGVGDNSKEELLDTFKSGVPNYTSTQYFAEMKKLFSE
jgi:hypothetical protein